MFHVNTTLEGPCLGLCRVALPLTAYPSDLAVRIERFVACMHSMLRALRTGYMYVLFIPTAELCRPLACFPSFNSRGGQRVAHLQQFHFAKTPLSCPNSLVELDASLACSACTRSVTRPVVIAVTFFDICVITCCSPHVHVVHLAWIKACGGLL